MCLFTGLVERVFRTAIFSRGYDDGRQALAYSMSFLAGRDVAMLLPLPVPPGPREDAVRFVNLKPYPALFADLRRGFRETDAVTLASTAVGGMPLLTVHEVGDFEASFVPAQRDFARLDPRFRLPEAVWDAMPRYRDYGFAVFKLKGTGAAPRDVHPMAFTFPRRDPHALSFPTVHVHDGRYRPRARFDHVLYCQADAATQDALDVQGWEPSFGLAHSFVDVARAEGLVDADRPCFRKELRGMAENQDSIVGPAPSGSRHALPGGPQGLSSEWLLQLPAELRRLEALRAALRASDREVCRRSLAEVHGMALAVRAIPDLLALLDHPDPEVRRDAARVLGRLGERTSSRPLRIEAAREDLVTALRLRDRQRLIAAFDQLAALGTGAAEAAEAELLAAVGDEDRHVRRAAQLLSQAATLSPSAGSPLVRRFVAEDDSEVRGWLAASLLRIGPVEGVVAGLGSALDHAAWAVRRLAADTLGRLGPGARAAVPALERLAKGPDFELQETARAALSAIRAR